VGTASVNVNGTITTAGTGAFGVAANTGLEFLNGRSGFRDVTGGIVSVDLSSSDVISTRGTNAAAISAASRGKR
jgi:hypothetical protein